MFQAKSKITTEILVSGNAGLQKVGGIDGTFTPVVYKEGAVTGVGIQDQNGNLIYTHDGPLPIEYLITSWRAMKLVEQLKELRGPKELEAIWILAFSGTAQGMKIPPVVKEEMREIGIQKVRSVLESVPQNIGEILEHYNVKETATISLSEIQKEVQRGRIPITAQVTAYFNRAQTAIANQRQEFAGRIVTPDEAIEEITDFPTPLAAVMLDLFRKNAQPKMAVIHQNMSAREVFIIGTLNQDQEVVVTLEEALRPEPMGVGFGVMMALDRKGTDLLFKPVNIPPLPPISLERRTLGDKIAGIFSRASDKKEVPIGKVEFTLGRKLYGVNIRPVNVALGPNGKFTVNLITEVNDQTLVDLAKNIMGTTQLAQSGMPPEFMSAWNIEEENKNQGFG